MRVRLRRSFAVLLISFLVARASPCAALPVLLQHALLLCMHADACPSLLASVGAHAAAHEGARKASASLTLVGLACLLLNAAAAAPFAASYAERGVLACALGAAPRAEERLCWDAAGARAATHVYCWWAVASAAPLLAAGALTVLRTEVNEAVLRAAVALPARARK